MWWSHPRRFSLASLVGVLVLVGLGLGLEGATTHGGSSGMVIGTAGAADGGSTTAAGSGAGLGVVDAPMNDHASVHAHDQVGVQVTTH